MNFHDLTVGLLSVSKQFDIVLPSICLALVFYIATYDLFVYTYSTGKVSFRPYTVRAPIDFLAEWELGLQGVGSVSLNESNDLYQPLATVEPT